ncbi:MAG: M48 family metallopeptidase [Jatrophihabitantaceae bacterium]
MATDRPVGVDFFARQHSARGTSVRLVALFSLAVVSIVVAIDLLVLYAVRNGTTSGVATALIAATAVTLLIIGGGTLSKMIALRAGGAAVAQSVGAVPVDPTTSDPQLRRYLNIVEEMSIASGVPVPRIFVLENEDGINAFAAGFGPADAAITVTAGALHQLNRDELQGVIGHEFSHVLNGDMRLNLRLIGLLNGILLIGLVGLRILQFGGGGRSRNNDKGGNPILVLAIAMLVLGFIGQFFAGLIKAAVSRQREWLADASSVQFTRQTTGLVGALKKIAGIPTGSVLHDAHSEKQINHMLFGEGGRSITRLWATHPPLAERIQALEPGFRPEQVAALEQQYRESPPDGLAEDAQLGFAPAPAPAHQAQVHVTPAAVAARVGTFTPDDLARGAALSSQLPPDVRRLATQPSTAVPLVLALLLDADAAVRDRQLALIAARLSQADAGAAAQLYPLASGVPPLLRIPLVSLTLSALTARPRAPLDALLSILDELALADGTFTVFEYCLTRLVSSYVRDALAPSPRSRPGRGGTAAVQVAATTLLAVVAAAGNDAHDAAERAFSTGLRHLGAPVQPFAAPRDFRSALDAGWAPLDALDPRYKRPLIEALVAAVAEDGVLNVAEAELLRTACSLLHCPLPAMLA